jgi:hypothetical protein
VKRGKTPVLTEARWDLEILPVTFHGLSIQWATAAEQRAMDVSVIGITRLIAAKESLPGQT